VFIVERLLDAAARQIGMDPRAIRKVNYVKPTQFPYTNAVGQVYDSGAFAHMLARASDLADWDGFAARKKAAKKKGLLYGRGLTSYIEWTGGRQHTEKVTLQATAEGRVIAYSGTMAMGQGLQTTYSQMISDALGIPIDRIDLVQGDTDVANGSGSVGSRSLFVGGTAVAVSTADMIAKAREKAANVLETSIEDIEYRDGTLTVVGTDRRVGLFDLAKKEDGARLSVDSVGEVDGPTWPNGTHICEVEIDPETGVTRVVRYTTVDDVGRAVNPMLVTGQVHGGVAQGIGQALYEGVTYDAEGQLLTATYQDYCIPRADDIPPIEVTLDGSAPCKTNPLGAKGCGESGAIGGPPCITNGVMDALAEFGITQLPTPLTPQKVWQAIRENPLRAQVLGVNVYLYRLAAATFSSVLAGLWSCAAFAVLQALGDLPGGPWWLIGLALGPVGGAANKARKELEALIEQRSTQLGGAELQRRLQEDRVDVTLPGAPPQPIGRLHLLTQTRRELEDIFLGLGFTVMEGPEIETVHYNFDALNHSPTHPARARTDTFYVAGPPLAEEADAPDGPLPPTPLAAEELVLRTHTSPMQVRAMEAHPPPLYVVIPGRVYRPDSDATHTPQFHQIEGLAVDEDITLADLKGTLLMFAQAVFGDERDVRLRPHFFPFTEPSVEVDVSCFNCDGKGFLRDGSRCPVCKGEGWLEVLGAGEVDPNVYSYVPTSDANAPGYDPEKVQGFAWGMGVERIAMLKHGVPDLRLYYDNDLRFLGQF